MRKRLEKRPLKILDFKIYGNLYKLVVFCLMIRNVKTRVTNAYSSSEEPTFKGLP